jgi:hypothetical protein
MGQYFPITTDPFPIDWTADGDGFLHFVDDGLQAVFPSLSGRHSSTHPATEAEPVLHYRFGVKGAELESELCAVPVVGGVYLFVRYEEQMTPEQVRPWLEAVSSALRQLNEDTPPMDWWAVIEASAEGGRQPALVAECPIDDLALTPTFTPYTEIVAPQIPQMGGGEVHEGWPVIVHGAAVAHSFALARESGAKRLGRLCALLSIATDYCWEILQAPQAEPLDVGTLPRARVPLQFPFPEPDESIPIEIADWVGSALAILASDTSLAAAVQSHHQGMMMERRFPSFAVIAYTAAIETIGRRYKPEGGNGEQFREALKRIRTSKARQALVESYDLRSQTAHAGLLHGAEELHGSFPGGGWLPQVNAAWFFRLGPVTELRQASRELLTMGGMGKLPAAIATAPDDDTPPLR